MAPSLTLTRRSPDTTKRSTATFDVASDDPTARVECRLRGRGTWEPCRGTYTVTGLQLGYHAVTARAVDAAGNASWDEEGWRQIEDTPEETEVISGPEISPNFVRFDVGKTGPELGCRLDGGEWRSCTGGDVWCCTPMPAGHPHDRVRLDRPGRRPRPHPGNRHVDDRRPDPDPDAHRDRLADRDAHAERDAHADADRDAHADRHAHADGDADRDPTRPRRRRPRQRPRRRRPSTLHRRRRPADGYGDPDPDPDDGGHTHGHAFRDRTARRLADAYADPTSRRPRRPLRPRPRRPSRRLRRAPTRPPRRGPRRSPATRATRSPRPSRRPRATRSRSRSPRPPPAGSRSRCATRGGAP